MTRQKEQARMHELLSEAIRVLCKASVSYKHEFTVEGLIGITVDREEIFLINLNQSVERNGPPEPEPQQSPTQGASPTRGKRRASCSPKAKRREKQFKLATPHYDTVTGLPTIDPDSVRTVTTPDPILPAISDPEPLVMKVEEGDEDCKSDYQGSDVGADDDDDVPDMMPLDAAESVFEHCEPVPVRRISTEEALMRPEDNEDIPVHNIEPQDALPGCSSWTEIQELPSDVKIEPPEKPIEDKPTCSGDLEDGDRKVRDAEETDHPLSQAEEEDLGRGARRIKSNSRHGPQNSSEDDENDVPAPPAKKAFGWKKKPATKKLPGAPQVTPFQPVQPINQPAWPIDMNPLDHERFDVHDVKVDPETNMLVALSGTRVARSTSMTAVSPSFSTAASTSIHQETDAKPCNVGSPMGEPLPSGGTGSRIPTDVGTPAVEPVASAPRTPAPEPALQQQRPSGLSIESHSDVEPLHRITQTFTHETDQPKVETLRVMSENDPTNTQADTPGEPAADGHFTSNRDATLSIEHQCGLCGKSYVNSANLRNHVAVIHQGQTYHCSYTGCKKFYKTKYGLTVHRRTHQRAEKFICQHCGGRFSYRATYNAHIARHEGKRPYKCPCGKTFISAAGLCCHKKVCGETKRRFICHCGKKFKLERYLNEHAAVHNNPSKYMCDICGRKQNCRASLLAHKKSKHPIIRVAPAQTAPINTPDGHTSGLGTLEAGNQDVPYVSSNICDVCGRSFANKTNLETHMRSHTGERFGCSICGRTYVTNAKLDEHVAVAHQGRTYHCTYDGCHKFYKTKYGLTVHNRTHQDTQKFLCTYCGEKISYRATYEAHMARHEGNAPHRCECGKAFFSLSGLTCHRHGCKEAECRYVCHCGKKFQRERSLNDHARVHDNPQEFLCPVCGMSFKSRSSLHSHKRKSHPKKDK